MVAAAAQARRGDGARPPSPPAPTGGEPLIKQLRRVQGGDLEKYKWLRQLQSDDPRAFFRLLLAHKEELLPLVYTPTVGEACEAYHRLALPPPRPGGPAAGLYLRPADAGRVAARLAAHPGAAAARIAVVTDGERVLGLGDLGANGMGICEGKALLYTACAGVPPRWLLPVALDVGTNNEALLRDPDYRGLRQPRLAGDAYFALVDELVAGLAATASAGHVLVHYEDFGSHNAFALLERHAGAALPVFNDDVQGTACVALAGLLAAARASGAPLQRHRLLFLGAGEAGTGIGELVALYSAERCGVPRAEGRRRCFYMDSQGLVTAARRDSAAGLAPHKRPFAHDAPPCGSLLEAVRRLRPTALVGVSAQGGAFTAEVLAAMAEINERPIVFALSNPTPQSECTFAEARAATGGRVIFASGSPFPPDGGVAPAQANNAYVFPPLGLAVALTRARRVPERAFLVAAEALCGLTSDADAAAGALFPRFERVRGAAAAVAAAVADHLVREGGGTVPPALAAAAAAGAPSVAQWEEYVRGQMWSGDAADADSKL